MIRLKLPITTSSSFHCEGSPLTVFRASERSEESLRFAFAYWTREEPRCLSSLYCRKESLFGIPSHSYHQKFEKRPRWGAFN